MSDQLPETGGHKAPRSAFRRLLRVGHVVLIAVAVGLIVALLAGRLPEGTSTTSLAVRAATGLAVGLVVIVFVRRTLRSLVEPPPPPPPQVDARTTDVVYECAVCGTRLRLEVAATGKAPRHCGEGMEPMVADRRDPSGGSG